MCRRSHACQELLLKILDIRVMAQREPVDPVEWATEIARQAARIIRHVNKLQEDATLEAGGHLGSRGRMDPEGRQNALSQERPRAEVSRPVAWQGEVVPHQARG